MIIVKLYKKDSGKLTTLYNYWRSSASFRVRIALSYKQIEHKSVDINLNLQQQNEPEYSKINPNHLVPALQIDSPKHELIYQSLAILEYLEEQYPQPSIIPSDIAIEKAYIRGIAMSVCCEIHPLNNLRVLNYIKSDLQHTEEEKLQWYHHWLKIGFDGLENWIKHSCYYSGNFCYKDKFSIADICLVPQIYNAKRFNFNLTNYPTLSNIYEKALNLEAVKAAYPKSQ